MRIWSLVLGIFTMASMAMAQSNWDAGLKKAKAERKFVLAYFTDPECFLCQRYASQTVGNPSLAPMLKRFVVVKMDVNREKKRLQGWLPNREVILPVMVITDSKGKLSDYVIGHLNADAFAAYLKAFLQGKRSDTVERKLKQNPNDLPTLYEAAVWYLERGEGTKGMPLAKRVLKMDADNRKGYYAPMRVHIGLFYATRRIHIAHLAIDEFRDVVERFPKTKAAEEARFYLAATHLALGQDAEAKRWLKEVLKTSKSPILLKNAQKLLRFLEKEPPADLRRGAGEDG